MARRRKQLDFRAVAEALTQPSTERVSMADIARGLGVAKPTLYRMAGSREELIAISIDAEAERLVEQIHRGGPTAVFQFARESPAGFVLLFGDRYPEARQAVRRVEARLARDSSDVAAAGLLGLVTGIARRAMEDGALAEPERLGSDFDDVAKIASKISDAQS
ncbi:MAG: TetR/AcrR family transcriptional regulator [Thermoleophilaceae bacterium]